MNCPICRKSDKFEVGYSIGSIDTWLWFGCDRCGVHKSANNIGGLIDKFKILRCRQCQKLGEAFEDCWIDEFTQEEICMSCEHYRGYRKNISKKDRINNLVVKVKGGCISGNCKCGLYDGAYVKNVGMPPFHDGCTCIAEECEEYRERDLKD